MESKGLSEEKKEDLCQEEILGTEMANLSKGSDAKLRV
jgi:hypothetical protein